jgi:predicted RND superfamily exporter protein
MKRWVLLVIFFLLLVISSVLIPRVTINYDLEKYLPEDSEIKEGMETYRENFGDSSFAFIAIDETSVATFLTMQTELLQIENVKDIIFLDDYLNPLTYSIITADLDITQKTMLDTALQNYIQSGLTYTEALYQLSSFFPTEAKSTIQGYYDNYLSDDHLLFQVIFTTDSSDIQTENALNEITDYLSEKGYDYRMKGDSVSTIFTKNTITEETFLITVFIIPIILLVLIFFSRSFFDIVLFIIVAGTAILINLGTNAFLPDISYITQSMAIALQLAISLDYIIFVLNSYHNKRSKGIDSEEAIKQAMKKTIRPVVASGLTTGVSFLALIFMKFSIGLDIGIVFAKAIMISLLTTLVLLPVLIRIFSRLIDRTKTKTKLIDFTWFARFANKNRKYRYFFLAGLLVIIAPLIYFQTQNEFTFGVSSFSGSEGTVYYEDENWINENFGQKNYYTILIEKNDLNEQNLYQQLSNLDYVSSVSAGIYYKSVITDPLVLAMATANLYSDEYALFQVTTNSQTESDEAFLQYEELSETLSEVDSTNSYILGETAVSYQLKDIIVKDFTWVLIIAIIAILTIIFFSFKNLLIPTILIVVIETAVFLSMSIINLFDQNLIFLAYLIVSTILLGATIDYAILFAKSYMEERENNDKILSIQKASLDSTPSIITSATLFIVAGLIINIVSSIVSISQIGLLIAIGAFVALVFVLIVLPQILYIFDSYIVKSKVKM